MGRPLSVFSQNGMAARTWSSGACVWINWVKNSRALEQKWRDASGFLGLSA